MGTFIEKTFTDDDAQLNKFQCVFNSNKFLRKRFLYKRGLSQKGSCRMMANKLTIGEPELTSTALELIKIFE